MDHKKLLAKLDKIEQLVCDLRLDIIEDIRGTLDDQTIAALIRHRVQAQAELVAAAPKDLFK
jgi:hypothetical protein